MSGLPPAIERPNRYPWPPAVFIFCLMLGYAASEALPFPMPDLGIVPRALGAIATGFGLMMIVWASSTLARARTAILPHMGANRLVTDGPFAWSRNPIYLGEAFLLAGFAGLAGSVWYLVAAITFANLVALFGIIREEAHLDAKFGEQWRAYAGRVRRWL